MTRAEEKAAAEKVEEERRSREEALILLLLALCVTARSHAVYAARSGNDPADAARAVVLGDNGGHFIGAAPIVTAASLDAWEAGYGFGPEMIGEEPTPPSQSLVVKAEEYYATVARAYVSDLAGRVTSGIHAAVYLALEPTAEVQAIRDVFVSNQLTRQHHARLETDVERTIVSAHNAGIYAGTRTLPKLWGFRHVSVLDEGTTACCRERAGLTLHKDHPYWHDDNWVPLHWSCRSLIRPVRIGERLTESTTLPTTPADPGFGKLPALGYLPIIEG